MENEPLDSIAGASASFRREVIRRNWFEGGADIPVCPQDVEAARLKMSPRKRVYCLRKPF